jgi:hypothetical protein
VLGGNVLPGPWEGQAAMPTAPAAWTDNPDSDPEPTSTSTDPPAPPPGPPSFWGTMPVVPFAVIVPVPLTLPARIMTMPPPVPPALAWPDELLRSPAPPPPPMTSKLGVGWKAAPPKPPWFSAVAHEKPPWPPAPPLPPPPPPVFWSLADGSTSVPPPAGTLLVALTYSKVPAVVLSSPEPTPVPSP